MKRCPYATCLGQSSSCCPAQRCGRFDVVDDVVDMVVVANGRQAVDDNEADAAAYQEKDSVLQFQLRANIDVSHGLVQAR